MGTISTAIRCKNMKAQMAPDHKKGSGTLALLVAAGLLATAISGCYPGYFTLRYRFPPTVQRVGLLVVEGYDIEKVMGTVRTFGPTLDGNVRYLSGDDQGGSIFQRVCYITKIHPGEPVGRLPDDYYAGTDVMGHVTRAFTALLESKGKSVWVFNDRISENDLRGRKVSEVVKMLGRQTDCDQIWVVHGCPRKTVSYSTTTGGLGVYVPSTTTTVTGPGIDYIMAAGIFDPASGKMLLKFNLGGLGVMNASALTDEELAESFALNLKNSFERTVFQ